jgi:hypothetical protein
MTCLLPDGTGAIFQTVFDNGCSRNPQLIDFDPTFALIAGRMFQVEKLRTSKDMIVIKVCVADHVVIAAAIEISLQAARKSNPLVRWIFIAFRIRVIEKNLLSAFKIDSAAIRIAEGEKRQLVHPIHRFLSDQRFFTCRLSPCVPTSASV